MKTIGTARKRKQDIKVYRRRRLDAARRASVPIDALLPSELYQDPSPIHLEGEVSDRQTATVAVAAYLIAAFGLVTVWLLNR